MKKFNKENLKNIKEKFHRISFKEIFEKMQENLPLMICTCIFSFVLMALVAVAVFFVRVEGPEKVMVPSVVGKKWSDALLEMQVKELYPKISLRYSDQPGDEGLVLDQSPEAGAIVKGYSRVNLVISRGFVVDSVDNYIGTNLDELKMKLQTLFAGSTRPLIVLGDIDYKPDASDAGTILEQDPPEGTSISDPVTVNLVVSRGPNYDNTKPPYLVGRSLNDVLQTITRSKLIFDFTSHDALDGEKAGTVTSQQSFDSEYVPNYTHIEIEMALPARAEDGNIYGLFDTTIEMLPYAVPMRLEAVPEEGDAYTIISFTHTGGHLTMPYAVPRGTKLILYVDNKARSEVTVN